MTNCIEKYLSPWIDSVGGAFFMRLSLCGKFEFTIYNTGSAKVPYTFQYPHFRYFGTVDEAKNEFNRLLAINGYILCTEEEFDKLKLLQ